MTHTQNDAPEAAPQSDSIGRIAELIGGNPADRMDADMAHVLDTMAGLGARPLEYMTPEAARRQPRAADAVRAILARQQREPLDDGVEAEDQAIQAGEDELPIRFYRPIGLLSRLNPVILYFHGGGFVTGDLDSHDASARALARRTGAIVVSVAYRLAPEHGFPAAHADALTAWSWLTRQVREIGGDPRRLAVAGEDAGANLAMHVALHARDTHVMQPVHLLLIHPMAGTDLTTPSYGETLRARPVGLPAMRWRFRHLLGDEAAETSDKRLDLVDRSDLGGLCPTTIVLAGIDPLRSEGELLAQALEGAGVTVNCWTYDGVTQGFFGLGLLVTKALFAQSDSAEALVQAFGPRRS
jgi:acetyl esterase/lipase